MSTAQSYIGHWLGYWDCVTGSSMARWSNAVRRSRKRKYGSKALMSDMIGAWDDAANAWCAALAGPLHAHPILFDIQTTTESDGEEISVFKHSLPSGDPEILWLGPIATPTGPGHPIDGAKVKAYWVDHTGIEIRMRNLVDPNSANPVDRTLQLGVYRGLLHVQQVVIAEIFVKVS